jgi:hypothetical protein
MVASAIYQAMILVEVDECRTVMFCRVRYVFKPVEFTLIIFTKSRVCGKIIPLVSLSLVSAIYNITHCSRNSFIHSFIYIPLIHTRLNYP